MVRKPRRHYPGACYHVILRENAGQNIFVDKQDRFHAYCLMTNHVHLTVLVADVSLVHIIQNLNLRYTRYINCRKNQVGHLFQEHYKALLIDADNYLLKLVRYIHNNPVWTGMVKRPDQY